MKWVYCLNSQYWGNEAIVIDSEVTQMMRVGHMTIGLMHQKNKHAAIFRILSMNFCFCGSPVYFYGCQRVG